MNQEKFVNAYVELLNATLTEALQKNLVLQVQKTLAENEISSAEQKVRDIEIRMKDLIAQRDQEIGSLKGQINEERRQTAIVANEREEIKKTNQHVDTFKNELVKARAEINRLNEELEAKNSIVEESKIPKLKTTSVKLKPTKETIKDAGNF